MKPDLPIVDMTLSAPSIKDLANFFQKAWKTKIFCVAWMIAVALLPPLTGNGLCASETSEPLTKTKADIGFVQSLFSGVNLLDAKAALKVFGQTMGKIHGYDLDVSVHTFRQARDILSGPFAGNMEVMLLDSWSYVEIEQAEWIEPLFVSSENGQIGNRYLLLTRGGGSGGLNDLHDKSLNLLTGSNAMLGIPWLHTLLLEKDLGRPEDFFSQLDYQTDPMPTILQVFFGQKDAALLDEKRFELMTDLNPQLNGMKTIETSEPFVSYILCFKRSGWSPPQLKQDIIRVIADLHLEPKAQQVFTLFKFGRLVPFEQSQLDTVHRLRQRAIDAENQTTAAPGRQKGN